jgi:hypothetical protein
MQAAMRTFEVRVYTLRSKEALDFYREQIYPRHLGSFPLFGIEAQGFWTAREDATPRLSVLASFAAGEDPGEVVIRWRQSGHVSLWLATSASLWMLASIYSLISLVPVNNRIKSWETSAPPADWKTYRRAWDMHHRWRTLLLTIAFAFLIVGVR